jgi:hypothetical protein
MVSSMRSISRRRSVSDGVSVWDDFAMARFFGTCSAALVQRLLFSKTCAHADPAQARH